MAPAAEGFLLGPPFQPMLICHSLEETSPLIPENHTNSYLIRAHQVVASTLHFIHPTGGDSQITCLKLLDFWALASSFRDLAPFHELNQSRLSATVLADVHACSDFGRDNIKYFRRIDI
ncbi:hypothetical protein Sjap_008480 [Stephania japonica]|uniref:Uncharacterized protein n=1 Tax=Stephania japonica TaxID=461633 RepID=A0AAP0JPK6_9MAGN